MPPLISICLPCLNARPFLEPRMESILAQTGSDWELIISDNYSDDGSWEFFQQLAGDQRVRLSQAPRGQMYANWNECLKRAGGEYVYVATADDTCEPTLLEDMVEALRKAELRSRKPESPREQVDIREGNGENKRAKPMRGQRNRNVDVAVCDYRVIDREGKTLDLDLNRNPRQFYGEWMNVPHIRDGRTEFLIHACLGIVWVTMTAVLFRRSLLDRIGLFRTDRGVAADHEWQMRACLASDIVYVPEKLATWRMHGGQASAATRQECYDRNILLSLESVLNDPNSGIPEEWKRVPGWRDKIASVQRSLYRDSFNLYGNMARRDPMQFLKNVGRALRDEPGLLMRQAARGLKWSPEFSVNGFETAMQLIELLGCLWPPKRGGREGCPP